jgi:spore coat protein U-like protein
MATIVSKKTLTWISASLILALTFVFGLRMTASANTSTNMAVSANVVAACFGLTANPLAFGNVTANNPANVDANTTVTFTCSGGTPWSLDADNGQHLIQGPTSRSMQLATATDSLRYGLYLDPGYTQPWGQSIGGTALQGMGTGVNQVRTIYGRIPTGQTVQIGGPYTDTVSVTLIF